MLGSKQTQAPFFTQSTNPHPLKFINHRLFACLQFCNSGVSWGSWTEWEGTVGKSPMSHQATEWPHLNFAEVI
jgi:hypothetical protein